MPEVDYFARELDAGAVCRDCGAPLDCWLDELRGGNVEGEALASDRGGLEARVSKPGACSACGGGRFAVRIDLL